MEGNKIYEESKVEITRILKTMSGSNFSIDTNKLDATTKEELLIAIRDVLYKRSRDIDNTILGVQ